MYNQLSLTLEVASFLLNWTMR